MLIWRFFFFFFFFFLTVCALFSICKCTQVWLYPFVRLKVVANRTFQRNSSQVPELQRSQCAIFSVFSVVRIEALGVLCRVAQDHEVRLLQLDEGVFGFLVDQIKGHVARLHNVWLLDEVMFVFVNVSRLPSNRRLIANDGG